MADKKNEPQSYGSQQDWLTGKTGQKVNPPSSEISAQHDEFYHPEQNNPQSGPHEGGDVSPVQRAENAEGAEEGEEASVPAQKGTDGEGGAKRGSYFKDRDYS